VSLDDQALRDCLDALARFFVGTASLDDTLRTVSELAIQALPQTGMTGITMVVDDRPRTAVFTDGEAADIDASQYGSGEGPCLEAFRTKQVIVIGSAETDGRFPSFCRAARERGVKSTLSLPLVAGSGDGIGALNLYSRTEAAYTKEDAVIGERFALQASVVLANSQAYWDARTVERAPERGDGVAGHH
jgi:GAF domain-containing protein